MEHLSPKEMMQWLDQTIVNGDQRKVIDHLERCAQCRKEIDLQQRLIQAARRTPLSTVSSGFSQAVMARIIPSNKISWSRRLLDNLGNIIGMAAILTIIGYALTHTSTPRDASSQPSQISQAIRQVSDGLHRTGEFIKQESGKLLSIKMQLPQLGEQGTLIMVSLLTFLALILFDRFFLQRLYQRSNRK